MFSYIEETEEGRSSIKYDHGVGVFVGLLTMSRKSSRFAEYLSSIED